MDRQEERRSLLRRILDEPDADAPRLIYADWLEEYGDVNDGERADFIRVQIEANRLRRLIVDPHDNIGLGWSLSRPHSSDLQALASREYVLFNRNWLTWTFGVAGNATISRNAFEEFNHDCVLVERGFVSTVRAPIRTLFDDGPAMLHEHPVTRMIARDRTPSQFVGKHHWSLWSFQGGPYDDEAWEAMLSIPTSLPRCVYSRLAECKTGKAMVNFDSPREACDALSDAILAECRERAGFTPPSPP